MCNHYHNTTFPFALGTLFKLLILLLLSSCHSPLIKTNPAHFSDTSSITIICDATQGNKGLLGFRDPVYIHLGLITDSSVNANQWRYVKFNWGSTQKEALATFEGNNRWSYQVPSIRKFFQVKEGEKILQVAVLFRSGNCLDTFCKVQRNEDKSDMFIPVDPGQ